MSIVTISVFAPIIIFSIIGVAIIIDKGLFFIRHSIPKDNYRKILNNGTTEFKIFINTKAKKTIFDLFLLQIISHRTISRNEIMDFIDTGFSELMLEYDKRISYLGMFAKLSTLIGLFGTVIGMIIAFDNIVLKGISNATIVAAGIRTAMLTTAAGLAVAIPATFFYDLYKSIISSEFKKMELIVSDLLLHSYKPKRNYME